MSIAATVFLSLAALCLVLAVHPFITYPLSLILLRKILPARSRPGPPAEFSGQFAICMCAYNEEKVIEAKIRNLLALREREPGLEILVYVDAATDRTGELLQPYAKQIHLHIASQRHGKTHGMNLLVARSRAPFIVFTDANVMIDIDAIQRLKRYFADPAIGCVCGNLSYINGSESITAATGSLYWRLEETIKSLEQATGSVMGADGSLFAIRRCLHFPPPDYIIDDMYVSFRILCAGYRIVQASDVKAYEKSVSSSSEEFQRKSRIACQAFNVHRLLWPRLKKSGPLTLYKYISHKLLRWLSIYFLIAAGILLEAGLMVMHQPLLATVLPVALCLGIWLGRRSLAPFAQILDVLSSLAGAGVGVWKAVRGEKFQTWQPAASLREQG